MQKPSEKAQELLTRVGSLMALAGCAEVMGSFQGGGDEGSMEEISSTPEDLLTRDSLVEIDGDTVEFGDLLWDLLSEYIGEGWYDGVEGVSGTLTITREGSEITGTVSSSVLDWEARPDQVYATKL